MTTPDPNAVNMRDLLSQTQGWTMKRILHLDWSSAAIALLFVLAIVGFFHPNFLAPGQLINVVQISVYAAWEGLLRSNPDAVAVLAPSAQDASAWGLLATRAGFKLPSGGFDLEAGNLQAVKDGQVNFVMSPEHWLTGYVATRALANAAIDGKPPIQGLMLVPGKLVSAENIGEILARQKKP